MEIKTINIISTSAESKMIKDIVKSQMIKH